MSEAITGIGDTSRLNALRVLIVDDCRAYRRAMAAMAMLHEAHVAEAESAAAGLMALDAKRFDLVITDIGLPDMLGSVVADRALHAGSAVLAVSAEFNADAAPMAHGFARKPFRSVSTFAAAMTDAVIARDAAARLSAAQKAPWAMAV